MELWRKLKREINRLFYLRSGRRPWSRGYGEYRQSEIERILDHGLFRTDRLPQGYGLRLDERVIEYPWLLDRLPLDKGLLLDAGSVLNHRFLLERTPLRNKRMFISNLAPEPLSFTGLSVSYVYEDLRASCFRNDYFDRIVSLSTLEHIGSGTTHSYTPRMSPSGKMRLLRDSACRYGNSGVSLRMGDICRLHQRSIRGSKELRMVSNI